MLRLLGRPWAFRRVLGMAGGGGVRYLLRDEFTTDRAAGAVNGTAAEPGPGTRTVVDTGSKVSITGGELYFSGPTAPWGDPALYYGAITRETGRMLIVDGVRLGSPGTGGFAGFDSNKTGTLSDGVGISNGIIDGSITIVGTINLKYAIVLRGTGKAIFVKGNQFTNWTYLRDSGIASDATVYPGLIIFDKASYFSAIRVPVAKWLPTPLLSDGFGSAFGSSDGLGHAEGIAGGIGAGGSGVTLSNAGGTWSVSGGKAINTAPSGLVQQISVANLSCADVYAGVAMTRALLTNVGLALNFDSASSPANGLLIYSDGAGNIKVDKIVAGSQTNVSTTAYTYSAGARLVCTMNAGALRVYYNSALITTATIVDAGILTGTYHGLFSTDASNTLDDLTVYATGTGGEYSQLDSY